MPVFGVATCLTAHACGHWGAPRVLCLSSRTELIHCELFVVELPLRVALLVRTATTTTTSACTVSVNHNWNAAGHYTSVERRLKRKEQ